MYNETCINRSCSKTESLLRRIDTFDPGWFLYTSLSRISNWKTEKRTLFQAGNFFQPSDKKDLPYAATNKNFRNFPRQEINWTFLSILSKRHIFLHFKITIFFCDFILQFWVSPILLSRTLCLFFHVAIYNRPTVALRHWQRYRTGTFKPYSTPLWTIGFRTIQYKFNDGGHYSKRNVRKKNLGKNTKGTRSINRSKQSRNVPQAGAFHPSINIWK